MKNIIILYFCFIMSIFLLFSSLAAQQPEGEELFRVKIPEGYLYKAFDVSPGGMKALSFLEHQEGSLYSYRALVKIFDSDNLPVEEKVLDSGWIFGGFTPSSALILLKGEADSLSEARIIDLQGRELLSIRDVGSRQLLNDLHGREIAVAALGDDSHYKPSVVYDLSQGREKFRLDPVPWPHDLEHIKPKNSIWAETRIFLPVGQDNLFLWGIGATILLQKYGQPGHIWKIDSIGGNINEGKFLGPDYLAVSYFVEGKKHKEGLAIIRWRDGQIVFRVENYIFNGKREKELPPLRTDYLYLDEDFNLNFLFDSGESLIIHFDRENKTWKEEIKTVRKYNLGKSISAGKGRPQVIRGHVYYAVEENDEVVVRKIKLAFQEKD